MDSGRNNGEKKILIVEDQPEKLTALTILLTENGYCVEATGGGQEALDAIHEENLPDIILLAICLPDIDGYEVCKKVKADQNTTDIPIIFMSEGIEDDERRKVFNIGGADLISKPFVSEELFARINTHIDLKDLQKRLKDRVEENCSALSESEARFRELTNASFEGIVITRDRRLLDFNDNFLQAFGYTREQALGLEIKALVAPESQEYVAEQIQNGNKGPYEHLAINKDGEIFPVEVYGAEVPYAGVSAQVTAVRDISRREGWELAVLKEWDRTIHIGTTISTGILIINHEWRITYCNDIAKDLLRLESVQLSPDEKSKTIWQVANFTKKIVPEVKSSFQRVMSGQETISDEVHIIEGENKEQVYISISATAFFDASEDGTEMVVAVRDISHILKTEHALRESEERFRSLFESVPVGLYQSQMDGTILNINQQFVEILGYPSRKSLMEKNARELYAEPAKRDALLKKLTHQKVVQAYFLEFIRYDGEKIFLENHARLVDNNGGMSIEGVVVDITEREKSQARHKELLGAYEHRSMLLQTAADISKSAIAILAPDQLMQKTVDLITERFGYYYVGIFLVDDLREFAVLQAGVGKPGKKMLAAGHKLAVGNDSMIGWCVVNAKARIALDVGEDAVRFNNPYLPKTRSEMALPLVVQGIAIGGLTVQSLAEAAFSEEDIAILQSMADQLAIAIQNARSYELAQKEIAERKRADKLLTAINKSALAMEKYLTHDEIFSALKDELIQLGFDCMLFPYHKGEKKLYTRYLSFESRTLEAARKLIGINQKDYSIAIKDAGIYFNIIEDKKTILLDDIEDVAKKLLPRKRRKHAKKILDLFQVTNVILAPLVAEDKIMGVLSIHGNDLKEDDTQAINAFANLVAASWRKADLFEQAQLEIAARKEAEQQLQLQAKALEAAANGIIITDRQGEILWTNPAFTRLSGYSPTEAIGKNPKILNSGQQDESFYKDLWDTILAGGVWHGELTNRREDGSLYIEDMTITPVKNEQDQITHFIAIKSDITERTQAEQALKESEEKFAKAFRLSPYPILLTALDDERIMEVNEGFMKVSGYQREEAIGNTLAELGFWLDPKDDRHFRRKFALSKGVLRNYEYAFRMKNGDQRLFRLSVERINISGNNCVLTVAEDITDRQQAQEQLHLQATALNAAANGIMISKLQDEIIWANPAMEVLTGYKLDEIIGQSPEIFSSGEHDRAYYDGINKTLRKKLVWQGEIINRRKDGRHYFEEQTIAPVLDIDGNVTHHVAIKYDITARKNAERETQRLILQLGALNSMGQAVTSSLEIGKVLEDVIREVPLLVGAESQSILLLEGDELVFVAVKGKNSDQLLGTRMPASQGIAGQVIKTGTSLLISEEADQEKIYRGFEQISEFKTKSIMAVPLNVDNEIIGVLEAVHTDLGVFDDDDLYIFETVAAWASIAIGNARHYEITQRRLQESEVFVNISRALSETLETQKTFRLIVDAAQAVIPLAEKTVIHLLDDSGKNLSPVAVAGIPSTIQPELTMRSGEGIAGSVIADGKGINVGDIQSDPRYIIGNKFDQVQSLMVVPVQVGERILGTISVQSSGKNAFSMDDMRLLTILGLQAGLAIENARQHEDIQRRFQESQTLAIISQALTETLELDEVLQLIGESVQQLIPSSEHVVIHLLDGEKQALWPTIAIGLDDIGQPEFNIRLGEGIAGRVVAEGLTINIGNVNEDQRYLQLGKASLLNSLLVAPVHSGQRRYGTISVQSMPVNAFSFEDERLLTILGFQAALAIKNARLFEAERDAREQSDLRAEELSVRERHLTIINDITRTALEKRDLSNLVQEFAIHLGLLFNVDTCFITLWDEIRNKPIQAAAIWGFEETFSPLVIQSDEPSITEKVLSTKDALIVEDLENNPYGSRRAHDEIGGQVMLALPLLVGEEKLGAAMVVFDHFHHFTDDEISLGKHAAGQIALAISKTKLLTETQRQFEEIFLLHAISTAASEASDESRLIERVTQTIGEALNLDAFGVLLLDDAANGLRCHPSYRGVSEDIINFIVPLNETVIGTVAASGEAWRIPDVSLEPKYYQAVPETRSELCVPIKLAQRVVGVINAESVHVNAFTEDDERLLVTIAGQMATTIERIRLFEATERQLSELSVLYDIAIAGTQTRNEDGLIEIVTEIIGRIFLADNYGIMLLDEDKANLYCHYTYVGDTTAVIVPIGKGITGEVVQRRQPRRISDVSQSSLFIPMDASSYSSLCAPLFAGDNIIGVINIESQKLNAFSGSGERLLLTISSQLSTMLDNLRLFNIERQRLKEVNVLYKISQAVVATIEVNEILRQATNLLKEDLEYYHVHIYMFDSENRTLIFQQGSGTVGDQLRIQTHKLSVDLGIVGYVARSGEAFLTNDVADVPFFIENPYLPDTIAELAVPLTARDEIFGVLDLQHRAPHRFTERDLRLVTTLADQIAAALDKAQLYTELQEALRKEKATRARLIQTEKLAAMGRLVASVAHELNNPLQAIQNALYLIQVEEALAPQSQDDLLVAIGETERMAGLIARLRETYRPRGEADFSIASLNEVVEEVHKLISTHLRHNNIDYIYKPDPNLPNIPMVRDQIKQVIINLAINAIESMPTGGQLTISTSFLSDYSLARLKVSDNGPGIEPEIVANIFEPFFTTKSKGTGLGLAVSYEIVQVHGGKISVLPGNTSGSTFEILLPLERV